MAASWVVVAVTGSWRRQQGGCGACAFRGKTAKIDLGSKFNFLEPRVKNFINNNCILLLQ
jgi:hypothetical protein